MQARGGQPAAALECFRRAADYLKRSSRTDEYLKVAERIAVLTPDDHALTRELAHLYLGKGDTKRALAKLQLCFKVDARDVETLQLLAQAFRDLGQTSKTLSVYKELAHVQEERGRAGEARAAWRKVQELAPGDPEAAAALGAGAARAAAPSHPAATPLSFGPSSAPPAFGPTVTPPPVPGRAPVAVPPPGARVHPPSVGTAPAAAVPPPAGGAAAIPKLLTETDVYLKYGLHDKALDHLRKVLALDPDCPEAPARARDVHAAARRPDEAAAAGVRAVRAHLARGEPDRARDAVGRLGELAPGHPEIAALAAAAGGGAEEVELLPLDAEELDSSGDSVAAEDDAIALAAAGHESDEVVEDEPVGPARVPEEHTGVEIEVSEGGLDAAGDALAEAAALASAEAEEIVDEEPPPARPPHPSRGRPCPRRRDEVGAARRDRRARSVRRFHRLQPSHRRPLREAARPDADARADPDAARRGSERRGGARPLGRARGGRVLPAAGAPRRGEGCAPEPPRLAPRSPGARGAPRRGRAARRARCTAKPPPTVPARARRRELATSGPDESFDIARELADELGGDAPPAEEEEFQYSVEDVFAQFKKGVEQVVRPEDSATHYDLGIAYKEMALLDDAVHEFEVALQGADKRRAIDCLSMIGLCRMAKGEHREAIRAFRRALASDALTKEAARAVQYELGAAHEAAGEAEVGLWFLQRVAKLDPAFRDVADRIRALGGGPGRAPADASRGARPPPSPAAPAKAPAAGAKKNIGYL
jgi:tetratricopeptide (TPR) repeat protein